MTDSENKDDGGGLPTAAIVDNPNSPKYEHCLKIPIASKEMSKDVVEWGDELVRRKDVKALIQDRLNTQEGIVENLNGLDRLDLNDAKARKQELENLLEELEEGEASK